MNNMENNSFNDNSIELNTNLESLLYCICKYSILNCKNKF